MRLDSGSFISALLVNCQLGPIEQMEWGHSNVQAFLSPWALRIARDDPEVWQQTGEDVYSYMTHKVRKVITSVQKPGQAAYAFWAADPEEFVRAAVWADGSHDQSSELTFKKDGEQWWPCIILAPHTAQRVGFVSYSTTSARVPFYCPVLALQNSRPWDVNMSRIREVVLPIADTSEPPSVPTQYFHTPGPVITELSEDESSNVSDDFTLVDSTDLD